MALAGLAAGTASSEQERAPGEYVVTLAASADVKAIVDVYGAYGIRGIQRLSDSVFLVILTEDPGPASMQTLGAGSAHIKAVEPNVLYRTQRNRTGR
jgi:hypothetical protein